MIQSLNPAIPEVQEYTAFATFQHEIEALENNPEKTDSRISGSIYVYDLVEQRNLGGRCSIASMLGYLSMLKEPVGLAGLIHPDDLNPSGSTLSAILNTAL